MTSFLFWDNMSIQKSYGTTYINARFSNAIPCWAIPILRFVANFANGFTDHRYIEDLSPR